MTGIQWTDETWNPTTGCDRVTPGCDKSASLEAAREITRDVVSRHELPGTAVFVEQGERRSAIALADDVRVRFAETPQIRSDSVLSAVCAPRQDVEVLGAIVELVVVPMVDNFTSTQRATEHLGCHEPVLVDVATRVCHGVSRSPDKDVAAAGDRSTALPVWVLSAWQYSTHLSSIANRMEQAR